MIWDPVFVILKYMSVKIFVIRVQQMDKYMLFVHLVCVY